MAIDVDKLTFELHSERGQDANFVIFGQRDEFLFIPDEHIGELVNTFCDQNVRVPGTSHLGEVRPPASVPIPLMIRGQITFPEARFDIHRIATSMVFAVQQTFDDLYKIHQSPPSGADPYISVVLTRRLGSSQQFHIQLPLVEFITDEQVNKILPTFKKYVSLQISEWGVTIRENIDEMFGIPGSMVEPRHLTSQIGLFGSLEYEGVPWSKLKILQSMESIDSAMEVNLQSVFFPEYHKWVSNNLLEFYPDDIEKLFPLFLSYSYFDRAAVESRLHVDGPHIGVPLRSAFDTVSNATGASYDVHNNGFGSGFGPFTSLNNQTKGRSESSFAGTSLSVKNIHHPIASAPNTSSIELQNHLVDNGQYRVYERSRFQHRPVPEQSRPQSRASVSNLQLGSPIAQNDVNGLPRSQSRASIRGCSGIPGPESSPAQNVVPVAIQQMPGVYRQEQRAGPGSRVSRGSHSPTMSGYGDDQQERLPSYSVIREESIEEMSHRFLSLINTTRFETPMNDNYAADIGRALSTIYDDTPEGYNIWRQYLDQYAGMPKDESEILWGHFRIQKCVITHHTLGWFALIDSPNGYQGWHDKWCLHSLLQSVDTPTDYDIANAFYHRYWLDYAVTSHARPAWYQYDLPSKKRREHAWYRIDGGGSILKRISEDFYLIYDSLRAEVASLSQSEITYQFGNRDKEKFIKKIGDVMAKLKKNSTKKTLLDELKQFYYKGPAFFNNLNSNPMVLGNRNCVIECMEPNVIIRDGKPEDYITMSTHQMYPKEWGNGPDASGWSNANVRYILNWFRILWPDKATRRYVWKKLGTLIQGGNYDKEFLCMSGKKGDEGKSGLVKAIEESFGDYCKKIPVSALTERSAGKSNEASPQMAQTEGCRVVFAQEAASGTELNEGFCKEITGSDTMFTRFLHENGKIITILWKIIFVCNSVPSLSAPTRAIKNRFRIIPFTTLFKKKHEAPATVEEQDRLRIYPIDPKFEQKIPQLAPALLWIMVQYYQISKMEGTAIPPEVNDVTDKYWAESDAFRKFIETNIARVCLPDSNQVDMTKVCSVEEVHFRFCAWYTKAYKSRKPYNLNVFNEEMNLRLGESVNEVWHGYCFRNIAHVDK
jgi:hypothetical protein